MFHGIGGSEISEKYVGEDSSLKGGVLSDSDHSVMYSIIATTATGSPSTCQPASFHVAVDLSIKELIITYVVWVCHVIVLGICFLSSISVFKVS
jgi:hypothetical protein